MKTVSISATRVFGLDLFRAMAILAVMYGHQAYLLKGDLRIPTNLIPAGVEWFFVLSGFLIGQIIIRDFGSKVSWKELFFFLKRRWFRTLPNYYLFLLLNLLLAYWGLTNTPFDSFNWKFIFFLQNFNDAFTDFFWESWSLSIEEWFYVFFPLLFFLLLRFTNIEKKKSALISILLLMGVPLLIKIIRAPYIEVDPFWFDNIFRKVVVFRLDSVIYGVLMAFVKCYFEDFWKRFRMPLLIISILYLQYIYQVEVDMDSVFDKVFRLPLNSIAIAFLLPFFDNMNRAPAFINRPIQWISKISYSLYLLHLGIVIGIIERFSCLCSANEILLMNILFWLISLFLASLVYYFFERPITRLRPSYQDLS